MDSADDEQLNLSYPMIEVHDIICPMVMVSGGKRLVIPPSQLRSSV